MDLPYCTEYAKSGKSTCKGCYTFIAKESLRLGHMVQSTKCDKKIPQWYHFDCFFVKYHPKSENNIRKFEALRIDDQTQILRKLTASKQRRKRGARPENVENFRIEYSKTGRAVCKKCETTIPKGEMRILKNETRKSWYHVSCFTTLQEFDYFESADRLPGFDSLEIDDQEKVRKELQEEVPVVKKAKNSISVEGLTEEESQLYIEQNEIMFKHRDALKENLNKKELTELLTYNHQVVPWGIENILDLLMDCMTFGALGRCKFCSTGQLVFENFGYMCTGSSTAYTKCKTQVKEPFRVPFKIPSHISEKYPYLLDYKFIPRTRVFKRSPTKSKILHKMKFIILGKPKRGEKLLKEQICNMGGQVIAQMLSREVIAVIASQEDVETMNNKMKEVKRTRIHVVPEEFVDEAPNHEGKIRKLVEETCICDWGSDERLEHAMENLIQVGTSQNMSAASSKTVKLPVKEGAVVDPKSGLQKVAHVYINGFEKFTAALSKTDIKIEQNSFYTLQLLKSNARNEYWVFRSWGRIGTERGGTKLEQYNSPETAKSNFCQLFYEKTRNRWESRHNFHKIPGFYNLVDVDYPETPKRVKIPDPKSTLPGAVQNLMKVIFDIDAMKKVLQNFKLDLEKMPLGKVSEKQIQKAFGVLDELQNLIETNAAETKLIDASNRFYSFIPHSFGEANPPVLKEASSIKQKIEMLESLKQIEIGYSLIKKLNECENTVDEYYKQLKTDIEVLDKDSEEYKIIEKYFTNTQGSTHNFELRLEEIFTIKRYGEAERFEPFKNLHNHKLLWHGSSTTNFAGILSQGLRIAPPEAPRSGYMFGKGIYFADMISKSAQYCRTNSTGLLLLCDVALGDMYEKTQGEYVERLPEGKHSTKGLGKNIPKPEDTIIYDGIEVPLGKQVNLEKSTALIYNEYIVYNVTQVKIKYLLKVSFK